MIPYLLAIVANFFWATVNIIDKYLIDKYCKDGSIGSLLILSSLFPITIMPIAYFFSDKNIFIANIQILTLIISGLLTTTWMFFYFRALFDNSVSRVIPLLQLAPVFSLLFGFILLGEVPLLTQVLAGAVIVTGSIILSFEKSTSSLKLTLLFYMLAVAGIISLMNALFKLVALESNFWISIFWHALGTVIAGAGIFIFNKSYRKSFIIFIRSNLGIGLRLNGINESLTVVGDIIFAYAILLAPLALVHTMEGFQPIIVVLLTFILAKLNISCFSEENSELIINKIQLLSGIILVVLGSILLALSSI